MLEVTSLGWVILTRLFRFQDCTGSKLSDHLHKLPCVKGFQIGAFRPWCAAWQLSKLWGCHKSLNIISLAQVVLPRLTRSPKGISDSHIPSSSSSAAVGLGPNSTDLPPMPGILEESQPVKNRNVTWILF